MSVTQAQYDDIFRWWNLYFRTPGGEGVLEDLLRGLGLFVPWPELQAKLTEDPAAIKRVLAAFEILAQLGVWRKENFGPIIHAMGALPLPTITGEQTHGETS